MRSIRTPAERAAHARIRDSRGLMHDNGVFPRAAVSTTSSSTASAKSSSTSSSIASSTAKTSSATAKSSSVSSTTKSTTSASSSTSHSTTSSSVHTTATVSSSKAPTANTILPAASSQGSPTIFEPSTTPSAANDASQTNVAAVSSGPSGAVIGVVVALVVVLVFGVGFFIVRKKAIRRRQLRRNTWGAGMFPNFSDEKSDAPPVPEKANMSALDSPGTRYQLPSQMGTSLPSPASNIQVTLSPPPMSYNNPVADNTYKDVFATSNMTSGSVMGGVMEGGKAKDTAVVRCVFIPSLPDELSINGGEIVYVLAAYDDGWAFCENARGEQGMIPLECLGRSGQSNAASGFGEQETNASVWRNSKRVSSLHGGNLIDRF